MACCNAVFERCDVTDPANPVTVIGVLDAETNTTSYFNVDGTDYAGDPTALDSCAGGGSTSTLNTLDNGDGTTTVTHDPGDGSTPTTFTYASSGGTTVAVADNGDNTTTVTVDGVDSDPVLNNLLLNTGTAGSGTSRDLDPANDIILHDGNVTPGTAQANADAPGTEFDLDTCRTTLHKDSNGVLVGAPEHKRYLQKSFGLPAPLGNHNIDTICGGTTGCNIPVEIGTYGPYQFTNPDPCRKTRLMVHSGITRFISFQDEKTITQITGKLEYSYNGGPFNRLDTKETRENTHQFTDRYETTQFGPTWVGRVPQDLNPGDTVDVRLVWVLAFPESVLNDPLAFLVMNITNTSFHVEFDAVTI